MKILLISFLFTPLICLGACMDFYNQELTTLQGEKFNL